MNIIYLEDLLDKYNPEVANIIVQLELKMNLSEIHKTVFQAFKRIYLHKKYFLSIVYYVTKCRHENLDLCQKTEINSHNNKTLVK